MKREPLQDRLTDKGDILRRMFECNPQPMWIYDRETLSFLEVNDAALQHYGYSRKEFLSMTIRDIRPEADIPRLQETLSKLGAGFARSGFWKHRRKDGSVFEVEISSHDILFSNRPARFVMVNDVTESRHTHEALRQSEEKYRDLFENANDAIFIVDSELRYLDANKKGVELLGYSREELLTMKVLDFLPPEQIPRSEAEFGKLRKQGSYEKFIGKVRTRDGRWLDVEISSSAIIADNQVLGSRDIMRDITDRKKMEEELLRAQKLESIGILAGGIAHDFNNFLTAIIGNISLAKMDSQPGENVYDRLEKAERASSRARNLTQQLLTFSRGGAPIKKTIKVKDLVQETVAFFLRGTKTRCEFIIPGELWSVKADEGQLSQVFNNLAINAEQAMEHGGKLKIWCGNITIRADQALPLSPGNYVKLTFTDQGTGIPQEHFDKIFDPYFTTKDKGNGFGLATSYSIIKRHEGHITVESEQGAGASFHIYLPAITADDTKDRTGEAGLVSSASRVLVIDDEEMIRDVAGRILISQGYEVAYAQDGQVALVLYAKAQMNNRPFDAVIMDLTIPGGLGGKETIGKLLEIDPKAKVIVSSGYSDDPIMSRFREYGFSNVVAKPYTVKKLSEIMRETLKE